MVPLNRTDFSIALITAVYSTALPYPMLHSEFNASRSCYMARFGDSITRIDMFRSHKHPKLVPYPQLTSHWEKVMALQEQLPNHGWVLLSDADTIITATWSLKELLRNLDDRGSAFAQACSKVV